MSITKLLDKLPDWPSFEIERVLRAVAKSPVATMLDEIIQRRMGDVIDWLRLTPNAL